MDSPHLLALGYGYVARHLARQLLDQGWDVTGTTRSPDRASTLMGEGVTGVAWSAGADPDSALEDALARATHILISIPPGPDGDPVLARLGDRIREAAASGSLRWVGLLSTTGVYGEHHGGWVDEDTPPNPGLARTRARVDAERAWTGTLADTGVTLQIFRISGIYGPGRSILDRIRAGSARRIVAEGSVFNRVHVDDICSALALGMESPAQGVFNLSDDVPASSEELLLHACALLGVEPPPPIPLEESGMSPMALSFWAENRRVHATRTKEVLGWSPRYPSYREGLLALLRS